MNLFARRLLIFGVLIGSFAAVAFALSQSVIYKPWGVPDSRRDDYDRKLAELDREAELRDEYSSGKERPEAKVSQAAIDFGWVAPGESLQHVVYVTNEGGEELKLRLRNSNSKSLTAEIDRETIPPGEEATCTIRCRVPESFPESAYVETLTLVTNDPFQSTINVRIQASPKVDLVLPPQIDFGSHDIGEASLVDFVIYSQLAGEMEVVDISQEGYNIQWVSTPENPTQKGLTHQELDGKSPTVANRIRLEIEAKDYGRYSDVLAVIVKVDGEEKHASIPFGGRVRPPIGFYGPEVDSRNGISFGTVESGTQHDLFVVVRSRADKARKIEVLGAEPKELETELTPLNTEGSYRLRISIPADCPYRRFNLAQQHGYVHIGDPKQPSYSGSLPVYGCVGDFKSE